MNTAQNEPPPFELQEPVAALFQPDAPPTSPSKAATGSSWPLPQPLFAL
jgi:hypothetical protein